MKDLLERNAEELNRLKSKIDETFKKRDDSKHARDEWSNACTEFYERYDGLAFPGGLETVDEKIITGDKITIDTAITFLECRPYFFRSGYIYKKLMRRLKQAPLQGNDKECFDAFMIKYREYKNKKG